MPARLAFPSKRRLGPAGCRPVPCRPEFHLEHSEKQRAQARHEGLEPLNPDRGRAFPTRWGRLHQSSIHRVTMRFIAPDHSIASLNWSRNAWNPTHGRALSVRIGRTEDVAGERINVLAFVISSSASRSSACLAGGPANRRRGPHVDNRRRGSNGRPHRLLDPSACHSAPLRNPSFSTSKQVQSRSR